jgi:hypothetical protein
MGVREMKIQFLFPHAFRLQADETSHPLGLMVDTDILVDG